MLIVYKIYVIINIKKKQYINSKQRNFFIHLILLAIP